MKKKVFSVFAMLSITFLMIASDYKQDIPLRPTNGENSKSEIPRVNYDKETGELGVVGNGETLVIEVKNQDGDTEYIQPLVNSANRQEVIIPLLDMGAYTLTIESNLNTYTGDIIIY